MAKTPDRIKIHEYTSLSVPPLARVKNQLKKRINVKPDMRVFQTEIVKNQFNFEDSVPYLFRGPGIGTHFYNAPQNLNKNFDFVYLGATDAVRETRYYLSILKENFKKFSLLIIGDAPEKLKSQFNTNNVKFTGRLAYRQVPDFLVQARYGLNLMPDKYPFNIQPSLKLLEYCAMGLKVISTDYTWVNQFESAGKARFFKINSDFNNFNWQSIESFDYQNPNLQHLLWPNVIERSGLVEQILSLCNERFG